MHLARGNDVVIISSKANQKRTSAKWDPCTFLVKFLCVNWIINSRDEILQDSKNTYFNTFVLQY